MEDENKSNNSPVDKAGTRQRLITELTQHDTWLRTLVDESPVGISISLDGVTLYANPACLRLFGYNDLSEISGTSQLTRVAPESRETVARYILNRACGKAVTASYEITGLRKDGIPIPLHLMVAPLRIMEVPVTVAIFARFSEKKKIEEALKESENRFRSFVESIDDFIAETDVSGKCTYASPKVKNLIGYLPEDVLGKSPFDFMEPTEAQRVSKVFLLSVQKEEPFDSLEHTLIHRNGTPVIAEVSGKPFFDGARKLLGYRTISHDITKRRQVEEALIAAEKKYRNIVENAVEGIFQTLPNGRFLDANPAMARILGYESVKELTEAIQDVGLQIYLDPGTRAGHLDSLQEHGFGKVEIQVRRKDGTVGWLFINTRVVRDGEGKTLYYEGFANDITERKGLEEKLQKANADLENHVTERTEELNRRSTKLEELNITLRTVLDQRDQAGKLLEQRVVTSINELVIPLLHTLRKTRTEAERDSLLDIIESSLNEIISPFTSQLTGEMVKLTQAELQIANCIRQGMRSKEIASLLRLSKGTIDFHRNNIRRKLGIKDRKTSLRSHLILSGQ